MDCCPNLCDSGRKAGSGAAAAELECPLGAGSWARIIQHVNFRFQLKGKVFPSGWRPCLQDSRCGFPRTEFRLFVFICITEITSGRVYLRLARRRRRRLRQGLRVKNEGSAVPTRSAADLIYFADPEATTSATTNNTSAKIRTR